MTASLQNIVASERYRRELTKAQLADLLRRLSGEDVDLLHFDEVKRRLRKRQRIERDAEWCASMTSWAASAATRILPGSSSPLRRRPSRWMRIDTAMNSLGGTAAG
ncbi:MAG: hypothetical protein R3A10_01165 [Caldilineaceae bacterium]